MRNNGKKLIACILTAILGLSGMNYPIHAQEIKTSKQEDNTAVVTEHKDRVSVVQSMYKETFAALKVTEPNAGKFYVTGDPSDGWIYSNNKLTFNKNGEYKVTGDGNQTETQIVINAGLTIELTIENVNCHPTDGAGMSIAGSSTVELVLEGDNKFVAGSNKYAGIEFNNAINGSLTIDGPGSLFAKAGTGGAGIGGSQNTTGNNITISGGNITVDSSYSGTGDGCGAGIGSGYGAKGDNHIIINNGTIFMNSSSGAGIGSGGNATGNNYITINGGTIDNTTIVAGGSSAGIGSGQDATGNNNIILINDGTINVHGNDSGIGSGSHTSGDNHITIKGGNVTATGSVGIGSGENAKGTNKIAIQGGVVNAKGEALAIGDRESTFTDIDISGGIVNATSNDAIAIGTISNGMKYSIRISGGTVTATSESNETAIGGVKSSTGSVEILGGSVKANGNKTSGINAISNPLTDGGKNEVYLAKLLNQSGVKKIAVDGIDYKISGNHSDSDSNFYLYLTGKNHIITADQNKYRAKWDNTTSTFEIKLMAPDPIIKTKQTANTITVTDPTDANLYGSLQYSLNGSDWTDSNKFDNLDSSTEYTVHVKYLENDTYAESDEATITVKTSSPTYEVTIPQTTITAGDDSKNEIKVTSMDIGSRGQIDVNIKSGIKDGKLTLTRKNDINNNTITAALLVNDKAFTDTSKAVATFKQLSDSSVAISFKKPTEQKILAGTYTGTVVFGISYSELRP